MNSKSVANPHLFRLFTHFSLRSYSYVFFYSVLEYNPGECLTINVLGLFLIYYAICCTFGCVLFVSFMIAALYQVSTLEVALCDFCFISRHVSFMFQFSRFQVLIYKLCGLHGL